MDPNNRSEQLKAFKETKRVVESFREQSYKQLLAPKPEGGQVITRVEPSTEIKKIQESISRSDFTYPRSIIESLAKIDPANPVYSNLLRSKFTFDQFEEAINSLLNNSDYYKKLDEKIEELSKETGEPVQGVSEAPVEGEGTNTPAEPDLPESHTEAPGIPSTSGLGGLEASFKRNPTFIRQAPRAMAERKNELLDFKKQAAAQKQSLTPQEAAAQNRAVVQKRVDRVKGLYADRAVRRQGMQERTQAPATRPFARTSQPGGSARDRIANSTRRAGRGLGAVAQSSTARNLESAAARGTRIATTRSMTAAGGFLGDLGKQFGGLLGGLGGGAAQSGGRGLVNFSNIGRNIAQRGRGFIGGGGGGSGAAAKNGERRIILWILLLIAFLAIFGMLTSNSQPGVGQVELRKTAAPMVIKKGEGTAFTITARFKGSGTASIQIVDTVPEGTEYVADSADNQPVLEPKDNPRKLTWTLRNVDSSTPKIVSFAVRALDSKDDFWIVNEATYTVLGTSGGGGTVPGGENLPANQETCKGQLPDWPAGYIFENPFAGNFGDPACNFSKDALYALLQQADPTNARYWFDTVVKCESGYNPNTWANPIIVGTPDQEGAWGLYQMGRGKNGPYDHGDVAWQKQTTNAVTYNNNLARPWRYWACASGRW